MTVEGTPAEDPPLQNNRCTTLIVVSKPLIINEIVVEATGVEPASENVTSQETTCVVGSCFRPSPETFAALAQNRQETSSASLRISPPQPRRSREDQPAV